MDNYKKLPIWFMTFGSLFDLCMFVLLVYQNIYLANTDQEDVPSDWTKFIKIAFIVGLCGPILNWIFIFFLITRLNEKIKDKIDPTFLDTEHLGVDDNDEQAVLNHSGEIRPVYYDDLQRNNYSRPLDSPSDAINTGF